MNNNEVDVNLVLSEMRAIIGTLIQENAVLKIQIAQKDSTANS